MTHSPAPTVLIVDDERNIRRLLRMYLEQEGFAVAEATNGESALHYLEGAHAETPTFLVLDLMLPGIDGWEICRRLRAGAHADLPILMLTARDEDVDKIVGLELGADDYVTKPFNPREVVARIKAILRRASPLTGKLENASKENASKEGASEETFTAGNLMFDLPRRTVTAQRSDGKQPEAQPLELRRREFDLLEALARRPEIVFSREQLLENVWGYEYYGQTRTVDVHIAALRRKLEAAQATLAIETVTGIGYRAVIAKE